MFCRFLFRQLTFFRTTRFMPNGI